MHGAILGKEGTVCIQNVAHTKYQDINGLKTKFHFKVLTVLEYVKKKKRQKTSILLAMLLMCHLWFFEGDFSKHLIERKFPRLLKK